MNKKASDLKELVVVIPLLKDLKRDKAVDDMAYKAAQKLSATPVQQFRYVGRKPSAIHPYADNLEYRGYGTPK